MVLIQKVYAFIPNQNWALLLDKHTLVTVSLSTPPSTPTWVKCPLHRLKKHSVYREFSYIGAEIHPNKIFRLQENPVFFEAQGELVYRLLYKAI